MENLSDIKTLSKYSNELSVCKCELIDNTSLGVDKESIRYLANENNYRKLVDYIRRRIPSDAEYQAEEVVDDLFLALQKKEDYTPTIDEFGNLVSMENFIYSVLENCNKQRVSKEIEKRNRTMSNIIKGGSSKNNDDSEKDIFETLQSSMELENLDNIRYETLDKSLENCLSERYSIGIDIYALLYIYTLMNVKPFSGREKKTQDFNKSRYRRIAKHLGWEEIGERKLLASMMNNSKVTVLISSFVHELGNYDSRKAVEKLSKYVYGLDGINRMIADV